MSTIRAIDEHVLTVPLDTATRYLNRLDPETLRYIIGGLSLCFFSLVLYCIVRRCCRRPKRTLTRSSRIPTRPEGVPLTATTAAEEEEEDYQRPKLHLREESMFSTLRSHITAPRGAGALFGGSKAKRA